MTGNASGVIQRSPCSTLLRWVKGTWACSEVVQRGLLGTSSLPEALLLDSCRNLSPSLRNQMLADISCHAFFELHLASSRGG
eukprot:2191103-Amphidinium_carterae.2